MSRSAPLDWGFLGHPAFAVFEASVRARLQALERFPEPGELRSLTSEIEITAAPWFEFAPQQSTELEEAGGFDALLARTGRVPTRPQSHHDLFGALVWLHYPALKTALHRLHLACASAPRGPAENAATHLDESGVLVLSSDPSVFEGLAALQWVEVLYERRIELARTTRFVCFGHGLLDSFRNPHPRLMGKALFARVDGEPLGLEPSAFRRFVDRALAKRIREFLTEPARLHPLPVLGIPSWSAEQSLADYQDTRYYRTARERRRAPPDPLYVALSSED